MEKNFKKLTLKRKNALMSMYLDGPQSVKTTIRSALITGGWIHLVEGGWDLTDEGRAAVKEYFAGMSKPEAAQSAPAAPTKTLWQHYLDYVGHVQDAGLMAQSYESWLWSQPEWKNATSEQRAAYRALEQPPAATGYEIEALPGNLTDEQAHAIQSVPVVAAQMYGTLHALAPQSEPAADASAPEGPCKHLVTIYSVKRQEITCVKCGAVRPANTREAAPPPAREEASDGD